MQHSLWPWVTICTKNNIFTPVARCYFFFKYYRFLCTVFENFIQQKTVIIFLIIHSFACICSAAVGAAGCRATRGLQRKHQYGPRGRGWGAWGGAEELRAGQLGAGQGSLGRGRGKKLTSSIHQKPKHLALKHSHIFNLVEKYYQWFSLEAEMLRQLSW